MLNPLTVVDVDIAAVIPILLKILQKLVVVLLGCVLIGCCHGSIKLPVHHLQLPVSLFQSLLTITIALSYQHLYDTRYSLALLVRISREHSVMVVG